MSSWELQLGNAILKIMGNPSQNAAAVQSETALEGALLGRKGKGSLWWLSLLSTA